MVDLREAELGILGREGDVRLDRNRTTEPERVTAYCRDGDAVEIIPQFVRVEDEREILAVGEVLGSSV